KNGIAAGIGLFIAFIGLQQAGVIVKDPGAAVRMNAHFASPDLIGFFVGVLTTAVLHARRVRGSILWGIVIATALACLFKIALPHMPSGISTRRVVSESMLVTRFEFATAVVALPPSLGPTFLKMDVAHALTPTMLPFVFVFLFMLTFDAIGTLIGVCEQVSDAIGTVAGAALGTSTVTSFIESAAGVEAGARTGLTGLVVAALFLLALFFSPLVAMIGAYPPITAPALTIVGAMMMQNVAKIEWKDYTETILFSCRLSARGDDKETHRSSAADVLGLRS